MTTPDTDPERDLDLGTDPRTEGDLTQLQDVECASCCGTRVIHDLEAGTSSSCVACAPASGRARGSQDVDDDDRITRRVMCVASAQICAIVEPELESARLMGREAILSPIASLAKLAGDYLDAERAFRRAEVRALIVGKARAGYDASLGAVVHAELYLRRSLVSSPSWEGDADVASSELHYSDLLEIVGNIPGVDVSSDPEVGHRALGLVHGADSGRDLDRGRWRMVRSWTRSAVGWIRGWVAR